MVGNMENLNIKKKQLISKGLSGDIKYYIETVEGQHFLLRISDIAEYDKKKAEFENMQRMAVLGVPMSQPIEFGISDDNKSVYTLLSWIDGDEVESILPTLTAKEQYILGYKSGVILSKIHKAPAPLGANWHERYFSVIDERLNAFRSEGIHFEGNELILEYIEANRYLLKDRPQCRHHGDYHAGNLIISTNRDLFVIDWHTVDFDNYGDPWIELAQCSDYPSFNSGQIDGYFKGMPPKEFWSMFAYYLSVGAITSIVWAKYYAAEYLDEKLKFNKNVLIWFNNMKNPVPTWYLKEVQL